MEALDLVMEAPDPAAESSEQPLIAVQRLSWGLARGCGRRTGLWLRLGVASPGRHVAAAPRRGPPR